MFAGKALKVVAIVTAGMIYGCGGNVAGTYKQEGKEREITLSKDGKIFFPSGDIANYTIDGSTIVVGSWAGGAKGEVSGTTLIFPPVDGVVSDALAGTWTKK